MSENQHTADTLDTKIRVNKVIHGHATAEIDLPDSIISVVFDILTVTCLHCYIGNFFNKCS